MRRKLLKASAWAVGGALGGTIAYRKPFLRSFFGVRSAWAQPTAITSVRIDGFLGVGPAGLAGDTGSDWWRLAVPGASTVLTISVTSDSFLDVELFLFAPGVDPTIGTNLLTHSFAPYDAASLAAGELVTVTLGGAGHYVLVIEDARSPAAEVAGAYSIVLTGNPPIKSAVQIADENAEIQLPLEGTRRDPGEPGRPDAD